MEASWRDRRATSVAGPVGAFVELCNRPLCAVKPAFQRFADTDLRQPADRLGGSVPDSLPEPLGASELGALRKRRHALARAVAVDLKLAPDRYKVQIFSRRGHRRRV